MLVGMIYTLVAIIGGLGIIMLLVSAPMIWRSRHATARRPVDWDVLRADVSAALANDDLGTAVKIYRERTGAGLADAAREVQRIGDQSG
jgi:uncharacterized iron-regulated membrane protein